jgi:hypothetical protein
MPQKIRKERITKKEFYDRGGFANSQLFRLQTRGGSWRYYVNLDRQPCQHNHKHAGYSGLGCALFRCIKCGDEYEKDVS